MQHSERHDRNLEIDPLWYTQPMKNCESVGDVVLASKFQALVLALRAALTVFGITLKCKKDNKINNSYNNNKSIIIYV